MGSGAWGHAGSKGILISYADKPEVKVSFDVAAAPQWINWNENFGALVRVNLSLALHRGQSARLAHRQAALAPAGPLRDCARA